MTSIPSPPIPRPASQATAPLERLIQRHSSQIGSLLRRLGVAPGDVDDARQRVWLTVSRSLLRIRGGAELAFLRAVARGEASHMRRTYARRSELYAEGPESRALDAASDEQLNQRQQLAQAAAVLHAMDDNLRTVLMMFELGEASLAEIALELGIPVGTVKSRLRRARAELSRRRELGPPAPGCAGVRVSAVAGPRVARPQGPGAAAEPVR